VSTGHDFSCGIKDDQEIACWGTNDYGQTDAPSGSFTQISSGFDHSCAVTTSDTVACWGIDDGSGSDYGQVTDAPSSIVDLDNDGITADVDCDDTDPAIGLPGIYYPDLDEDGYGAQWTSIAAGPDHNCAMDISGKISCWGLETSNEVSGAPSTTGFVQLVVANDHGCGLANDGSIECWGDDSYGLITSKPWTSTYTSLETKNYYACALDTAGAIECWGNDSAGQAST